MPEIDFRDIFRFCKVIRVWPWGRCDGRRCDAAAWAGAGVTGYLARGKLGVCEASGPHTTDSKDIIITNFPVRPSVRPHRACHRRPVRIFAPPVRPTVSGPQSESVSVRPPAGTDSGSGVPPPPPPNAVSAVSDERESLLPLPEIDFRVFVFRFCKVIRVWPWGRCDRRRCDAAAWAVAGVTGAGCACEGSGVTGAGPRPVPVTSQRQAFKESAGP